MHLSAFVVTGRIFLQEGRHGLVVYNYGLVLGTGVHDDFKHVQQLSRISSGETEKSLGLLDFDIELGEKFVFLQGPVQKLLQVLRAQ